MDLRFSSGTYRKASTSLRGLAYATIDVFYRCLKINAQEIKHTTPLGSVSQLE